MPSPSDAYFDRVVQAAQARLSGAVEGHRNKSLNREAFALGQVSHLASDGGQRALSELCVAACALGLPKREVTATAHRAFARGAAERIDLTERKGQASGYFYLRQQPLNAGRAERLAADAEAERRRQARQQDRARSLWAECQPSSGTPAETYLHGRGIRRRIPEDHVGFHPTGGALGAPCCVFRVTDQEGGTVAVQRVPLLPDGSDRDRTRSKRSLGPVGTGYLQFGDPDPQFTVVCEGPEDALAIHLALEDITAPPHRVVAMLGQRWASAACDFPGARFVADSNSVEAAREAAAAAGGRFVDPRPHGDANDMLLANGPEALFQAVRDAQRVAPSEDEVEDEGHPLLELVPFDEDAQPWLSDAWLIEDVLPEQGLGVIFGAPGSRKTFAAIDLALHVAAGLPSWRGKRVERRLCVYLSLEGGNPFKNRLTAWRLHHDRDAPLFYRSSERLDLRANEADAARIIASGKRLMSERGERMGLVVVDTLNRAIPGGNENAVEDMGAFIAHCDSIQRELGCLVLVVHHSGKDAARGSRGHSSLLGAIDTEISLADGVMTITKQRDGEDGLQFGVELEVVEIGATPNGKRVFSCVAVEAEINAEKALPPQQRETLEAVREYLHEHGVPNPAGTGWPEPGARKVAEIDAILAFLAGKQTSSAEKDRRKCARRKLDRLIEKGIMQVNQGSAWMV